MKSCKQQSYTVGAYWVQNTVGDNTALLTRSPHFSSSSTDVLKGAAVTSSVVHDMPSLVLASYLALN